jgi:hypothetical protein
MDAPAPVPDRDGKPKLRRPRETRPLTVSYEIVVVGGEEGRKLHQRQSQAVVDALLWLANNPKPAEPDPPSNHKKRRVVRPEIDERPDDPSAGG